MKKFFAVFLISIICLSVFAKETDSLQEEINGVTFGSEDFGWGIMPVGAKLTYKKYIQFLPIRSKAKFLSDIVFTLNNTTLSTDYDYNFGRPRWILRENEIGEESSYAFFDPDSIYFNPRAYADIYFQQGILSNPLYPEGTLIDFRVGLNFRYSMAVERQSLSWQSSEFSPLFVGMDGSLKDPFSRDFLGAYPWLTGSRSVFTAYTYAGVYLNMDKNTPTDAEPEHGLSANIVFEYGPWWFMNSVTSMKRQSDFWRISGYFEQKMEVFSVEQDNGWNWFNFYVGHSDQLSYIGGEIVPYNMIPTDRLRGTLTDSVWLHLTGPQFLSGDCYTFMEFKLSNVVSFGGVVNESDGRTFAVEVQSGLSAKIQLRLWGFLRFEYQLGYNFVRGIWPEFPTFWQNAEIQIYVSI